MNTKTTLFMALLITGNMIGAGILAMPIVAGIAGFFPSLVAILFFWASMFFSGFVLVKEINEVKEDSFNLPSLYEKHFGASGKWLTSLVNIMIFYGVMTSYLAGSTKLVLLMLHLKPTLEPLILLLIFILLTALAISSIKIIERYNTFFMLVLAITFLLLIGIGSTKIESARLTDTDWYYLPVALPMIIAGFVYHYILPSVCKASGWSNEIYKPIVIGLGIALVMNIIWLIVGIGVVPEFGNISLNEARLTGAPVTVAMSQILGSELFLVTGSLFAIVAITTSYISIGMSLKDFLKDIFQNTFHIKNKYLILIVAFIPPLAIAYLYADIFLKALDFVAGIGVVLLFGVLPSIIAYKRADSKVNSILAIIFFIVFSITLVITLLQTFGLINITPH